MRIFSFGIDDHRCLVPTRESVVVRHEVRPREIAIGRLDASRHHLAVEVREGGGCCFA